MEPARLPGELHVRRCYRNLLFEIQMGSELTRKFGIYRALHMSMQGSDTLSIAKFSSWLACWDVVPEFASKSLHGVFPLAKYVFSCRDVM